MKKLIFWILVILAVVYWDDVYNIVTNAAHEINTSATQWLVNHTPPPQQYGTISDPRK